MAINGLPVTRIGANAFSLGLGWSNLDTNITSITVPEGILSIGDNAFAFLDSLTSISLPNSVTNIGIGLVNNDAKLGRFTFPNKLTVIPESTFDSCTGLTNVVAPPGLTRIDPYAFIYCGIEEFTLPDTVTTIADSAFGGCDLTTITFPASVQTIGWHAFAGCYDLAVIRFKGNAPTVDASFQAVSGDFFYINGRTGFDEAYATALEGTLGLWEDEVLFSNGSFLTGLTPGQFGAVWKTNSVLAPGGATNTIIYLGLP
jgi:hypothetical protein